MKKNSNMQFTLIFAIFLLATTLTVVGGKSLKKSHYFWNCIEQENSNKIFCNTTAHTLIMKEKVYEMNMTNCVYDPIFFDPNTTDCDSMIKGVALYVIINCFSHINSHEMTPKCRLYRYINKAKGPGVLETLYTEDQPYYKISNGTTSFDGCRRRLRYPYISNLNQWQYLYNCQGTEHEINCFSYDPLDEAKLMCEYYFLEERSL